MLFSQKTLSAGRRRKRSLPPLSVGRHVFVDGGAALLQGLDGVPLTDEGDTTTVASLGDALEVEVMGWRQRPRVRYHIRCVQDGTTGWVWAEFLRTTREPEPKTVDPSESGEEPPRDAGASRRGAQAPSRRTPDIDREPARSPRTAISGQSGKSARCSVCHESVHPYNLWRNVEGTIVGCVLCQGRKA